MNFTDNDRTNFGAGRDVRVIVNNPTRARHGKTGTVQNNITKSELTGKQTAWVFWDDDHYPSGEFLTNLAPEPTTLMGEPTEVYNRTLPH